MENNLATESETAVNATIYDEVLNTFCSADSPKIQKPFLTGKSVFATNGHIGCAVRADLCNDYVTEQFNFSVFDLREQSADDLAAAEEKYLRSPQKPVVTNRGELPNCVSWFLVRSGASVYKVFRFFDWCFCECEAFKFGQKACKHIICTFEPTCGKCGRAVAERGQLCSFCEQACAPYLHQPSGRKPERVGSIRF